MRLKGLLARHYLKFLLGLVGVAVIVVAIVFIRSASLGPEEDKAASNDGTPVIEENISDAEAAEPEVSVNQNSNSSAVQSTGGTSGSITKIVTPVQPRDTEKPVITLIGPAGVNMDLGSTYVEQGATWTDNVDGSGAAIINGAVDVNRVGTYYITYDYTDRAGNVADQKVRMVVVTDVQKPEIQLMGDPEMTVFQYSNYVDAGATAIDNCDSDIANKIIVGNPVDTNIAGDYIITYNVSDASGNKATEVIRLVHIVADHSFDNSIESNFESGLQGWTGDASLLPGGNESNYGMRMVNPDNAEAFAYKPFDFSAPLSGYDFIEFDINLNGNTLLPDADASALIFQQDGEWKYLSVLNYGVINGFDGWQHVRIALTDFVGLNPSENIGYVGFRFWNYTSGNYDIDNISLEKIDRPNAPTDLNAILILDTRVDLVWQGDEGLTFYIYQDGNKIAETTQTIYSVTSLAPDTSYNFYVVANDGENDSYPCASITEKTLDPSKQYISDFEGAYLEGWSDDASLLSSGANSSYAMRLTNPVGDSASTSKIINGDLAKGFLRLEFDINLNGNMIAPDNSAMFAFDQSGQKTAFLANYILENGSSSWQHVVIPFSAITDFDPDAGFASMIFRFWNGISGNYDIDNIVFSR